MENTNEVKKLTDKIKCNHSKKYREMRIEEFKSEFRDTMKFQQESF